MAAAWMLVAVAAWWQEAAPAGSWRQEVVERLLVACSLGSSPNHGRHQNVTCVGEVQSEPLINGV